ncbi:MAG: hypothetical protein D6680_18910 [Cyanobacteria bacterium J007]|nr:MAG: hypothetical protein D6680_18910 [Cyanobacteria bacterium J007]
MFDYETILIFESLCRQKISPSETVVIFQRRTIRIEQGITEKSAEAIAVGGVQLIRSRNKLEPHWRSKNNKKSASSSQI